MEVIELQVFEFGLGGREHFLDPCNVLVHRAAHIHQQQHFHVVVTFRHHFDVEPARIGGGGADGIGQIQLFGRAFTGKLAQPAQGHLDVAGAQLLAVVVVLVGALVPDLDGAFVAAFFLTDANALGVVAVGAKGAGAAGTNPFGAAFVAFFLFFKTLFQGFHQLVPAEFFYLGLFFGTEFELQVFAQPLQRHFLGEVGQQFNAFEIGAKGPVKFVEVLFVFDQGDSSQVVEVVDLEGAL